MPRGMAKIYIYILHKYRSCVYIPNWIKNQKYAKIIKNIFYSRKYKTKSTNNKAGECVEKREPSCTVGGNVNGYNHCGEQYGGSLKN